MPKSKPKSKSPLLRQRRFQLPVLIAVAALVVAGGFYLVKASHAASGVMNVLPTTTTAGLGDDVTVTVRVNGGTDALNAIEADLTYPTSMLQYVSYSNTGSAFPLDADSPSGTPNGTLQFARSIQGGATAVSGDSLVVTVTFKAIGQGSANIGLATSSLALSSSTSANVLVARNGNTITVADTTAPSTPAALTKTTSTLTAITLGWAASTDNVGVTGYKIFRGGSQIGTISATAATTYTDTGLAPGTSYNYAVAAYDAAGNTSAQTAGVSMATLADTTGPATPSAVTKTASTLTSVSLSWPATTDNVGVTGYKVFRNGTQIGTTVTTTYTDSGLSAGTAYTYTVAAYDGAGNTSAQSAGSSISTLADTSAPSVPTGLKAGTQTSNNVSLSWAPSTDNVAVTGYKVYRNGTQVSSISATASTTMSRRHCPPALAHIPSQLPRSTVQVTPQLNQPPSPFPPSARLTSTKTARSTWSTYQCF